MWHRRSRALGQLLRALGLAAAIAAQMDRHAAIRDGLVFALE
jgi:hypothetical protein